MTINHNLPDYLGGIFIMDKKEKKNIINALIMFGEQNNWIYR